MKTVVKGLVSSTIITVAAGGDQVRATPASGLIALQAGQYYKVSDITLNLGRAAVTQSLLAIRDETALGVTTMSEALVAVNSVDFYVANLQAKANINFDIAVTGTSSYVSALQNPHQRTDILGATELDSVLANSQMALLFVRGDIESCVIRARILYDVVALSDSERIEVMQRCACLVADQGQGA